MRFEMPYVDQKTRALMDGGLRPTTPGELNYAVTLLVQKYVADRGLSYQSINDVLGALDGASKEFYRRVAGPYEDAKIAINGDVYYL
jgi:hypothetical protein